jgi:hypothetical protein
MNDPDLIIKEPVGVPGQTQPWREWWPPEPGATESMTEEERQAKPWLDWKPNPQQPNEKPWLEWVPRDAHIIDGTRLQGSASNKLGSQASGPDAPESPAPTPQPTAPASSNAEGG